MVPNWNSLRSELLDAYDSIHWLTLTKWFYGDYPDGKLWWDRRLWLHVACTVSSQVSVALLKMAHLVREGDYYEFIVSLTCGLVQILVAFRTYVLYTRLTSFRRLYFKPEVFHSNKHRPNTSLPRLIQVMKHSRKVGVYAILLFLLFDVSLLVLPIVPPLIELASGTNRTYDELIPMYPSPNPVSFGWLPKELKYAFELITAVPITSLWVGFVVIYYSVVNLLREQHVILMKSLASGDAFSGDDLAPINLKLWIEDHVLLRRLVYELRDTMSPELAGTVAVNVFTLGLNMLQLTSAPIIASSAPLLVKMIFYFNASTYVTLSFFELLIHCWLADEITNSGIEMMNSIYESAWYTKLKSSPADMVLPIMMCQKPIRMTGLGLIPVSIETFTETVRLSYSYFTLLRRT